MAKGSKNKEQNSLAWKSENTARYILWASAYKERAHSTIRGGHISRYKFLTMFCFFRLSVIQGDLYLILLKVYIYIIYILLNMSRIMYRCICIYVHIYFNGKVMALKISLLWNKWSKRSRKNKTELALKLRNNAKHSSFGNFIQIK